jgi:hypothetical protein
MECNNEADDLKEALDILAGVIPRVWTEDGTNIKCPTCGATSARPAIPKHKEGCCAVRAMKLLYKHGIY